MTNKASTGNFFEDFSLGQVIHHATPRTITEGDAALYTALTGSRFLLASSVEAAKSCGHKKQLLDDVLVFHIAFGKTVNDISFNAVANLGYADVQFLMPAYVGDTLTVSSKVIGLRENKSGKSGIVYVHSTATNQQSQTVLSFKRWVMVHKKNANSPKAKTQIPELPESVAENNWHVPEFLNFKNLDFNLTGSTFCANDYQIGESIDHLEGMTIDNSDHTLATKLYQNNARVHFDAVHMQQSQFKQRLMYGGHIISIARALSFNGLQNALGLLAINGGSHLAPSFAGDTIYAKSQVIDKKPIPGRDDITALRLKTWGLKNTPAANIDAIYNSETKRYHSDVVLEIDYSVYMPC